MSPEDEVVYSTNDGNEFFSWNVPLPRALATGQISFDGEEIAVDGIAYHDHNWGNLNIRKCLRGWIWARVLFNNFTLIFADIKTRAPEEKVRILLFIDKDGNKIDTSFLQSDDIHFTNQNRSDLQLPQKITISFNNRQTYTVHLTIKQHYPVQEFPLGSLENHLWNSLLTKAYYLFKLNNAPCFIKKIFGQNLYFQFIINAELYVDDALIETHNGNLEVFSFAD